MGQERALRSVQPMSVILPKADIGTHSWDVRFVPKADMQDEFRSVLQAAV
jgi:hypothetical protein